MQQPIIILTGVIALLSGSVITLFFVLYRMKYKEGKEPVRFTNLYKDKYTAHYFTSGIYETYEEAHNAGVKDEDYVTTIKI